MNNTWTTGVGGSLKNNCFVATEYCYQNTTDRRLLDIKNTIVVGIYEHMGNNCSGSRF